MTLTNHKSNGPNIRLEIKWQNAAVDITQQKCRKEQHPAQARKNELSPCPPTEVTVAGNNPAEKVKGIVEEEGNGHKEVVVEPAIVLTIMRTQYLGSYCWEERQSDEEDEKDGEGRGDHLCYQGSERRFNVNGQRIGSSRT